MEQSSRSTIIVIFANEIRLEVEVLTREDGNRRIYFAANSLMINGIVQLTEREFVWLLADDIVLDAGIPPEL